MVLFLTYGLAEHAKFCARTQLNLDLDPNALPRFTDVEKSIISGNEAKVPKNVEECANLLINRTFNRRTRH